MSDVGNLVQDFITEPGVFYKSVAAARGRDHVLPVVGKHLYREIVESCLGGGRIDVSRAKRNYSLLSDSPMTAAAMVDVALAAAAAHGINWAKLRKDKIVGIELVISLPVGFNGDARAFFVDALAWVRFTFPQPVTIIAAVVHRDEAAEHVHIVLLPITGSGSMSGHQVIGYKGVYNKRVTSFHERVAQRYGLRKPKRKAKMTYQERQQLAKRVLVKMAADGAAWTDNPAAVAAMRKMLTADPMPMARALGLVEYKAGDVVPTAYAVAGAVGSAATAGASSTAFLCYAVDPDLVCGDLVSADGAGPVVALPDHHDGEHILSGEAWLVLPTWQLAATGSISQWPQPIPIVLDATAGQPVDDEGDDGDFVRVRDDQVPVCYWHGDLGESMPPAKPPSRQAQARKAVQDALTNLARVPSKQSIR